MSATTKVSTILMQFSELDKNYIFSLCRSLIKLFLKMRIKKSNIKTNKKTKLTNKLYNYRPLLKFLNLPIEYFTFPPAFSRI